MSVQDCGHPDVGPEILGIYAKIFERAGSACKEKVLNEGLVIPCQGSQFIGKRKGCQGVVNGQELFLLTIQPECRVMILALGATAFARRSGVAIRYDRSRGIEQGSFRLPVSGSG